MNIKLLALDMDDTLLRDDLTISNKNKIAISKAINKGVKIVLASGRTYLGMKKYVKALGLEKEEEYVVCSNGTMVIQTNDGQDIFSSCMTDSLKKIAYEETKRRNLPLQYYTEDEIVANFDNEYTDIDCKLTGMNKRVAEDFYKEIMDYPVNKMVISAENNILLRVQDELKEKYSNIANIFISKPIFLEVLPKEADKKSGLKFLTEKLGLKRENVMAMGDAMNDKKMLEFAGHGVAMNNAVDGIKEIADFVIPCSNEEDGVAWAIEEFILK